MKKIYKFLCIVLLASMVSFSIGLTFPSKVHAQFAVWDFLDELENTLSEINGYAEVVQSYVLEPIAFIASGRGVQQITSGVLQFVDGVANGTGVKQFIQNIRGTIQTVGDIQNGNFVQQFTQHSTSPFTSSIATALNLNYLQSTSLSGFFGGIQNTLLNTVNGSTASLTNFLNGDWSAGGASTWLSLTTQDQNNPYTLYSLAQNEMGSLVTNAQQAKQTMASWGNGFTGWCGDTSQNSGFDDGTNTAIAASGYQQEFYTIAITDGLTDADATAVANLAAGDYADGVATDDIQTDIESASTAKATAQQLKKVAADIASNINQTSNLGFGVVSTNGGVKAGDPCTNKDGTPGTVQTPGSVIQKTLTDTLGLSSQKIATIGNVSGELSQLVSTVSNIVKTTTSLLGNNGTGSEGGIAAAAGPATAQMNTSNQTNSYGGLSVDDVFQNFQQNNSSNMTEVDARVAEVKQYSTDWSVLNTAATRAMTNLENLVNSCTDEMSRRQGGNKYDGKVSDKAQQIRSDALQAVNSMNSIISQANQASTNSSELLDVVQRMESAQASGDQSQYINYYSQFQALPPTDQDVQTVLNDVQTQGFSNKVFSDPGTFTVTSGSILNQIKFYQLRAWCAAKPIPAESCNDIKHDKFPDLGYWTKDYVDPTWTSQSCQGLVSYADPTGDDPTDQTPNPVPVNLTWQTSNATSFSIDQIGSLPLSGGTTTMQSSNVTYEGTVIGPGGTATCSVTANVASSDEPTCTLTVSTPPAGAGSSATLSWVTNKGSSFSISPTIGDQSSVTSGSVSTGPLNASTVYTGTVIGAGGIGTCTAVVSLNSGSSAAPTCSITETH